MSAKEDKSNRAIIIQKKNNKICKKKRVKPISKEIVTEYHSEKAQ